MQMTTDEIRDQYLDFFKAKKHAIVPRANVVPQEDPTTLFTGSGMQPMIPYLLGATHPEGRRIADSQVCFRSEDIEGVGDDRHTTCFEMLGNWSLGDYFKKEQLPWFFEFLIEVVGLDPNKLYVTCFIGDKDYDLPKDEESATIWQGLFAQKGIEAKAVDIGSEAEGYKKGMQDGRIFFYDGAKNWWSRAGGPSTTPIGDPCGPDSEVFYDFGLEHDPKWGPNCHPNCDCGRFFEIGNSVFMEYKRTDSGFEKLPEPNVDFGGGLERIAAAAIDSSDMFRISLLWPIIEKLQEISGKSYDEHTVAMQVIADHMRGAVFLSTDGVVPSNTTQGYVLRRLVRRAIRQALSLGIERDLIKQIVSVIVSLYKDDYPEVVERESEVLSVLSKEESTFRQTLQKGLRVLQKTEPFTVGMSVIGAEDTIGGSVNRKEIDGKLIFRMYDTYGFPPELSLEEAEGHNIIIDPHWQQAFDAAMQEQKERSRTATKGQFKGGLGGHSDMHRKYHTATHLMYKALRQVLGDHVMQRGSNVTEERLRFDFSHPQKLTDEEKERVEQIVNEQIANDLTVSWSEIPTGEAFKKGALGAFGDKYGETVKVYQMGRPGKEPFSMEICGGPHVEHTGELAEGGKHFKIAKEESSSAGVRRIKAVLR